MIKESEFIMSPIISAFANIEKQDRRVNSVFLPRDKFYKLMLDYPNHISPEPNFRGYSGLPEGFVNNPALMQHVERTHNFRQKVGELYGASVYLTSETKGEVISEPYGNIPFGLENHPDIEKLRARSEIVFLSELLIKLKKNLTIIIKSRAKPFSSMTSSESVAIETLREMISETDYRRFLKYQFILVKGLSGDIYQIFRDQAHTKVWRNGKVKEEVCIRIKDFKVPLTDKLIAFKTIIETDENEFRKLGNVYKFAQAG